VLLDLIAADDNYDTDYLEELSFQNANLLSKDKQVSVLFKTIKARIG
jgi:hypothetical protein